MSRKSHGARGAFGRKRVESGGSPGYVYHFTDTARLPWILESGELKVDRGAIGKYPTKFVWATTLGNGDRTCAALNRVSPFKEGLHRLVRFTFRAQDFEPWDNIRNHPDWTAEVFGKLDQSGRRKGGVTSQWRVRAKPMPIKYAVLIETKTHKGAWELLQSPWHVIRSEEDPSIRGIAINGLVYRAAQFENEVGAIGYLVIPPCAESDLGVVLDQRLIGTAK